MGLLVLMRHGQSEWVSENRFAGWADVPLSANGRSEAIRAGKLLKQAGLRFDELHTSYLARAQETMALVAAQLELEKLPEQRDWRLNERHYGELQGQHRRVANSKYGSASVISWRRSYRSRPPAVPAHLATHPANETKYQDIDAQLLPGTESLEDAVVRVGEYFNDVLRPQLLLEKNILVIAHTASIRGITRILESLNDVQTEEFRIATCIPLCYHLGTDLKLIDKEEITKGISSRVRRFVTLYKPRHISWI